MIMKRLLGWLRQHWPQTHIVLRGDGHFANPELMELIVADGNADFIPSTGSGQASAWVATPSCRAAPRA
jgi:hypothetical protein